jgi:Abortive infection alpha
MPDDDPIKMAKEGVSLVAEVLKAAGDNPQVKEAAGNLGQTALTLTKTINNVLVPLAAINFAFDKARAYFSGKFQQDIAEKAQAIPLEHAVEPKASIAGPTLQGLAFAHEEPNLKEMYLNLLATSMDGRSASLAHPAFVEIIKQLDSEDARLVQGVLQSASPIPIIQIHRKLKDGSGYNVLVQHLLDLKDLVTDVSVEDPQLPAMIDNWIRLGLVEVDYDTRLTDAVHYSWADQRPEFLRLSQAPQPDGAKVEYQRGIMQRTELGKRFARAVGLQ